jgi:L-rhamnose mutarotase
MKRVAFKMKLKSGFEEEYKKRHDKIWPELSEELSKVGVSDYSIFFDEETNSLFAFQKLTDKNTSDKLPKTEIVRKWWDYMSDIMEVNVDNSPVVAELKEVFHQD